VISEPRDRPGEQQHAEIRLVLTYLYVPQRSISSRAVARRIVPLAVQHAPRSSHIAAPEGEGDLGLPQSVSYDSSVASSNVNEADSVRIALLPASAPAIWYELMCAPVKFHVKSVSPPR
jgi:hypothetical protein